VAYTGRLSVLGVIGNWLLPLSPVFVVVYLIGVFGGVISGMEAIRLSRGLTLEERLKIAVRLISARG
jgi:hypothetical protein